MVMAINFEAMAITSEMPIVMMSMEMRTGFAEPMELKLKGVEGALRKIRRNRRGIAVKDPVSILEDLRGPTVVTANLKDSTLPPAEDSAKEVDAKVGSAKDTLLGRAKADSAKVVNAKVVSAKADSAKDTVSLSLPLNALPLLNPDPRFPASAFPSPPLGPSLPLSVLPLLSSASSPSSALTSLQLTE
jgi:hypothetical protein